MTFLKTGLLGVCGGAAAALGAAAADDTIAQEFSFTDFDEIEVAGVYELDVTVGGEAYAINLSGPEEELSRVDVSVEDGVLTLDQRRRRGGGDRESVKARISLPALNGLSVSGVVEADIAGVEADAIEIDLSGVGEIDVSGACGRLTAKVSGVGELDAEELVCEDVKVTVSGVGEASVYASEAVNARVSGMGEIDVYGSPKQVTKKGGLFSDINIK